MGYSINKNDTYCAKFMTGVIGDYEVTYNQRSSFHYRAFTECHCFFIRKRNWLNDVINNSDHNEIAELFKQKIIKADYKRTAMIEKYKRAEMEHYATRHDYQKISAVTYMENS